VSLPYLTRLDVSEHVANNPADTLAKRVIASNLDHLANSHGQVLVNWSAADGAGVEREITAGTAYLWQSAPMALKLHPDGGAFPWRVRLRARRVSGSATITFYVGVHEVGFDTESFTTTSTSSTWLTAVGDGLLETNADRVRALRQNIAAPQTLGGVPIAYPEIMARVFVYATCTGTNTVELTGLHIAEFIGA
jgi:hypothetical protein